MKCPIKSLRPLKKWRECYTTGLDVIFIQEKLGSDVIRENQNVTEEDYKEESREEQN